jgi:hypothetical protein
MPTGGVRMDEVNAYYLTEGQAVLVARPADPKKVVQYERQDMRSTGDRMSMLGQLLHSPPTSTLIGPADVGARKVRQTHDLHPDGLPKVGHPLPWADGKVVQFVTLHPDGTPVPPRLRVPSGRRNEDPAHQVAGAFVGER